MKLHQPNVEWLNSPVVTAEKVLKALSVEAKCVCRRVLTTTCVHVCLSGRCYAGSPQREVWLRRLSVPV